ncbi:MAG: hypothetical protein M9951_17650 [Burkholderiaceae bacterium]|nr:hypothetical protein [Burkholderiaceae bacterium]
MPRRNIAATILLVAFAATAWASTARDEDPPGARAFAGHTYEGSVRARVQPPKGAGLKTITRRGTGTAELQMTGKDTARLLLVGNVEKDNDASFAADGSFVGDEWRSASGQRGDGTTASVRARIRSGRSVFS